MRRLDAAWQLISDSHRDLPADIRLEEQLTWLSLRGDARDSERIENLLMSVTVAMVEQQREGLARWVVRALPLLPGWVQSLEPARLLVAAAYARLGNAQALADDLATGPLPRGLRWAVRQR